LVSIHVDVRANEALVAQAVDDGLRIAVQRDVQQGSDGRRQAVGQVGNGTKVEHAQSAIGGDPEVARVRVGMQQAGPLRTGEQEPDVQRAGMIALSPGCHWR
jgi:hypothetical protein